MLSVAQRFKLRDDSPETDSAFREAVYTAQLKIQAGNRGVIGNLYKIENEQATYLLQTLWPNKETYRANGPAAEAQLSQVLRHFAASPDSHLTFWELVGTVDSCSPFNSKYDSELFLLEGDAWVPIGRTDMVSTQADALRRFERNPVDGRFYPESLAFFRCSVLNDERRQQIDMALKQYMPVRCCIIPEPLIPDMRIQIKVQEMFNASEGVGQDGQPLIRTMLKGSMEGYEPVT